MQRVMRWFTRSVFALAISAALGFGGFQAFGSTSANSCEFDPPIMGPCTTQKECQGMCDNYYGEDVTDGVCSQNCCVCLFL